MNLNKIQKNILSYNHCLLLSVRRTFGRRFCGSSVARGREGFRKCQFLVETTVDPLDCSCQFFFHLPPLNASCPPAIETPAHSRKMAGSLLKRMKISALGYSLYFVVLLASIYFWPLVLLAKYNGQFREFYYSCIYKILSKNPSLGHYYPSLFEPLHEERREKGKPLRIVEIGPGNGGNLMFYPADSELITVEQNECLEAALEEKLEKKFPQMKLVKCIIGDVTKLTSHDIPDNSVDIVVLTHALCCIQNDIPTIKQVHRILKRGGKLFTLEIVQRLSQQQSFIEIALRKCFRPFFRFALLGCRVGTQLPQAIILERMGFDVSQLKTVDCPDLPIYFATTTYGVAVKQ